ncbi:DNA-binding protein [Opitutaceae bacterium TAV5]|nr:DNA-binding protein [Opitutaceae bacterium TAV5]
MRRPIRDRPLRSGYPALPETDFIIQDFQVNLRALQLSRRFTCRRRLAEKDGRAAYRHNQDIRAGDLSGLPVVAVDRPAAGPGETGLHLLEADGHAEPEMKRGRSLHRIVRQIRQIPTARTSAGRTAAEEANRVLDKAGNTEGMRHAKRETEVWRMAEYLREMKRSEKESGELQRMSEHDEGGGKALRRLVAAAVNAAALFFLLYRPAAFCQPARFSSRTS